MVLRAQPVKKPKYEYRPFPKSVYKGFRGPKGSPFVDHKTVENEDELAQAAKEDWWLDLADAKEAFESEIGEKIPRRSSHATVDGHVAHMPAPAVTPDVVAAILAQNAALTARLEALEAANAPDAKSAKSGKGH